jgi:hypothetical protein
MLLVTAEIQVYLKILSIFILFFKTKFHSSEKENNSEVPMCDISVYLGRAIAQAVSRRLSTAAAGVQTRVWSCGIS